MWFDTRRLKNSTLKFLNDKATLSLKTLFRLFSCESKVEHKNLIVGENFPESAFFGHKSTSVQKCNT